MARLVGLTGAAMAVATVLAAGACTPPPPPTSPRARAAAGPSDSTRTGAVEASPDAATAAAVLGPTTDPAVAAALARSCYPCHSAERHDPWYGKLAPSSWGIAGGKKALDFSTWPTLDQARRGVEVDMVAASIERGSMPPVDYAFLNRAARLDAAERSAIAAWAAAQAR